MLTFHVLILMALKDMVDAYTAHMDLENIMKMILIY